jgi:hypothetical protein
VSWLLSSANPDSIQIFQQSLNLSHRWRLCLDLKILRFDADGTILTPQKCDESSNENPQKNFD